MLTLIYIGADMDVTYSGARIASTDAYLNTGTCTYALKTSSGAAVSGGTGTLSYVASSDGDYAGVIDTIVTAALTEGSNYLLDITFVDGAYNDFRRIRLRAVYRS